MCQAHEKKAVPGPVSKHTVNYGLVEERVPFYATIKTMIGRET